MLPAKVHGSGLLFEKPPITADRANVLPEVSVCTDFQVVTTSTEVVTDTAEAVRGAQFAIHHILVSIVLVVLKSGEAVGGFTAIRADDLTISLPLPNVKLNFVTGAIGLLAGVVR